MKLWFFLFAKSSKYRIFTRSVLSLFIQFFHHFYWLLFLVIILFTSYSLLHFSFQYLFEYLALDSQLNFTGDSKTVTMYKHSTVNRQRFIHRLISRISRTIMLESCVGVIRTRGNSLTFHLSQAELGTLSINRGTLHCNRPIVHLLYIEKWRWRTVLR